MLTQRVKVSVIDGICEQHNLALSSCMHDAQKSLPAIAADSALVLSVLSIACAGNGLCLHAERILHKADLVQGCRCPLFDTDVMTLATAHRHLLLLFVLPQLPDQAVHFHFVQHGVHCVMVNADTPCPIACCKLWSQGGFGYIC